MAKRRQRRAVKSIVLVAAVCIFIVVGLMYRTTPRNMSTHAKIDYETLRISFNQLIVREGIIRMYDVIRQGYFSGALTIHECHSLFHQLGHAAYEFNSDDPEVLGSGKDYLCMGGFTHGVEAQIAMRYPQNPDASQEALRSFCKTMRSGSSCFHGAGHAFIQRFDNNIEVALSKCDELVNDRYDPYGCYTGVFSEYKNYLDGFDGDNEVPIAGVTRQVIPVSQTFDVCLNLAERYQDACVSQFAGYLVKGDWNKSIVDCISFPVKVQRRCVRTITAAYILNTFPTTKIMYPAAEMNDLATDVRHGVIDGVYEGLIGFRTDFTSQWDSFCDSLLILQDKTYCQGKVL